MDSTETLLGDLVTMMHHESHAWIESQLAQSIEGKTVAVTHFLPHRAGIHPIHTTRGSDELTPYFTADCSSLMQRYRIDAWLCGHTHNSIDLVGNGHTTRFKPAWVRA